MTSTSETQLTFVERPAVGQARGVLILLHGVGANEGSLSPLAEEQDNDIAVVMPRGPLIFGPDAFGWYPVSFGATGSVIDVVQAEHSRRTLVTFVGQQQRRLGLTPAQTIVAGFSQGGIMSASIALTAPACLTAFGVLSGRILSEIDPIVSTDLASHSLEGLVTHGRDDAVLPFHLAEASARRLDALGVRHSLLSYAGVGHAMSEAMRRDFRQWTGKQFGGLFETACR